VNTYTIIGPGAIGTFLACRLHQAGYRVLLVDHRPERARRLGKKGLTLLEEEEARTCAVPVSCSLADAGADTVFVVCVKAHAFPGLLARHGERLGHGKGVVVVQNGMAWPEACGDRLPPEAYGGGIAYFGVTLAGEGEVRLAGRGPLFLGPVHSPSSVQWSTIAADFRRAGMDAEALSSSRFMEAAWRKLLVNIAINPLTVLFDCANGELLDGGKREELLEDVVREGAMVARACGVRITKEEAVEKAKDTCRKTARNISSMLQDVRRSRPTEIDALTGSLLRYAAQHDIPVPVNRRIYQRFTREKN